MDIDEFCNLYFQKLEKLLALDKNEALIKHCFGGIISTELICQGCPHFKEKEEEFLIVNLKVLY